jgi:hypothetical protein
MIYYGSKISDNLSTSPEGFLICHNVPIARTGYQDYLGSELPQEMQEEYGLSPQKMYKIYRSVEEVFSPATIASFEGKPFTDNHPTETVTIQNIGMYGKGHIQNIRRGSGEYQDMLIADIICTDEIVSNSIQQKLKREVSCGYDNVIVKGKKGFEQTQIRGNHLALVENGRAGQKAAIQDSFPDAIDKQIKEGETNKMAKNIFHKMFAAWAKDADPGEIEQALSEMGKDEDPGTSADPQERGIEEVKKDVTELKNVVSEIVNAVKQLVESGKSSNGELSDEDKLKELEKDSLDEPEEGKQEEQLIEANDADPETEEEKTGTMDAAIKDIVKAMKPKLLAIPDEKARTQAVDAFVSAVKDARAIKPDTKNDYAALLNAVKSNQVAKDSKPKTMDARRSEQVSAINKYNPHVKKEDK